MVLCFFFSSRSRHTRCALVTGVQTCALPIYRDFFGAPAFPVPYSPWLEQHRASTRTALLQLSVFGFEPCDLALCEIASLIDPMIAGAPSGEIAQSLLHRSDFCIGPCGNLLEPGNAKSVEHGLDRKSAAEGKKESE